MGIEKAVYLAGPITGLSYQDAAQGWRRDAVDVLSRAGICGVSPMRGKTYLRDEAKLDDHYDHVMSTPRGIMTRDFFDCTRCGVVLANLLGAEKVSIGTVMEMAWAFSERVPLIVCMEPNGNPHEHAMVNEAIGWRVDNLDAGLDIVIKLFTGYTAPHAMGD